MNYETEYDAAFNEAKKKALTFTEHHNDKLPQQCPKCGEAGHVPGLPCSNLVCGYCHEVSWAIVQPSEFGYNVVPINKQRKIIIQFNVSDGANDEPELYEANEDEP